MTGRTQVVLRPDRYNKLIDVLERLELAEVKARMALEDANSRVEQLEDVLSTVKDFAADYAAFNTAMERIVKMCEEGEVDGKG